MPIEEYLGSFHAMIDAHDSVSTFANFGDGVVEWTFQRDKVEVGSGGGFDPPATIHGGAGTLHTGPCKIYESDVKHPGTGQRVGWNILSLQNRSLAIPCAPDVPRHHGHPCSRECRTNRPGQASSTGMTACTSSCTAAATTRCRTSACRYGIGSLRCRTAIPPTRGDS